MWVCGEREGRGSRLARGQRLCHGQFMTPEAVLDIEIQMGVGRDIMQMILAWKQILCTRPQISVHCLCSDSPGRKWGKDAWGF